MYANEINLGQRGSFSIDGFGEAAQAYFGKDVRQLDLAECALLAGMIQSPNRFNPFRHAGARHRAPQPGAGLDGGNRRHHQGAGGGRQDRSRCTWFPAAWTPAKRPTLSTWCTTS